MPWLPPASSISPGASRYLWAAQAPVLQLPSSFPAPGLGEVPLPSETQRQLPLKARFDGVPALRAWLRAPLLPASPGGAR